MTAGTVTIVLPGTAYYECFDPHASGMAGEIGLPVPTIKRAGKGHRVTYENVTREQAREVADHLVSMGELWLANSDPEFNASERSRYRTLISTGSALRDRMDREEADVSVGDVLDGMTVTSVVDNGIALDNGKRAISWSYAIRLKRAGS